MNPEDNYSNIRSLTEKYLTSVFYNHINLMKNYDDINMRIHLSYFDFIIKFCDTMNEFHKMSEIKIKNFLEDINNIHKRLMEKSTNGESKKSKKQKRKEVKNKRNGTHVENLPYTNEDLIKELLNDNVIQKGNTVFVLNRQEGESSGGGEITKPFEAQKISPIFPKFEEVFDKDSNIVVKSNDLNVIKDEKCNDITPELDNTIVENSIDADVSIIEGGGNANSKIVDQLIGDIGNANSQIVDKLIGNGDGKNILTFGENKFENLTNSPITDEIDGIKMKKFVPKSILEKKQNIE